MQSLAGWGTLVKKAAVSLSLIKFSKIIIPSFLSFFLCQLVFFLHTVAVRQRSYDMALSLIMGGAFVEQVCLRKWTATHEAAKVNSTALILAKA